MQNHEGAASSDISVSGIPGQSSTHSCLSTSASSSETTAVIATSAETTAPVHLEGFSVGGGKVRRFFRHPPSQLSQPHDSTSSSPAEADAATTAALSPSPDSETVKFVFLPVPGQVTLQPLAMPPSSSSS